MDHLKKGNLASPEAQNAIYNDGELAFFTDLHNLPAHSPIQLEIYIIGLVREGKGIANINGNNYEIQKNDLFVCQPYNIVEKGLVSLDFKGYFILVSTGFMQRTMPMAGQILDFKFLFEQNPVCSLLPEEAKVFCQYYELLYTKIQQASPMQKKVIDTLMLAFFYDMKAALNRVIRQSKPRPFSAGENLFRQFIELIESTYPKPRMVSWYADQLHVTPKYLSTVCRKAGNESASDIIDRYVLKDINLLMKHSSKSIKEIAYELEFPNLSFFGKYVKTHFGMSPKAYREQMANGNGSQSAQP